MTVAAESAAGAASLVQSIDWLAIAPPTITAVVALIVLVADLFVPEHRKPLLGGIAIAGLVAALLTLIPLRAGDRSTFCLTTDAAVCSYTADHFALVIQLLVLGGALLTALISLHDSRKLPVGEYWFLLLASAAGAALLPASRDLATLVVALEVASLPAFALVGLRRGDRLSSEAALKFFLSSVTATAVMLLGVSFVYAATGTLHLTRIAAELGHVPGQLDTLAKAGVALTLVGFAFKTAAAPFHFWVPDTYVGAPLPIAAYLSVVGKAVGFSGLILVTVIAFPSYREVWGPVLAVIAALTMTLGNAAALRQSVTRAWSAVRLLAWSSVGQAGYLLVPIAAAAYAGGDRIGSTVAYALMYAVVNLGAFAVVALVARTKPLNRLADYQGLYARQPLVALAMGFFLLCLAGLPPGIIGLFAKVTVFSAAVDAGLGWLAVVMAANVVIALYYYLQWTAALFRAPEPEAGGVAPEAGSAAPEAGGEEVAIGRPPAAVTVAIALTAAAGVALSGAPQLVLRFAGTGLF
ncbi:NADH-quinone oxidoreductase subunit N [Streptomyces scopuliridis]|uniref:NADH-quinone oxidoreductase subunit N n=1 Tax=Streptomyces scopuliridis TaxID=452529 RepID=A0ACD4ZK76_9ACTN|nr:NADH-quinone oxidoreductase subunit N [Streptomyces scopuliridis]WSB98388.1 NADH-quinone oxidoreductase subunit N [Streptomyces scopuliridis]WSC07910.1 NADH-quinone oxidoreductase subunit N [Streptomyces scopuliridis]